MNLENKQLHIERMSVNNLERENVVLVHVYTQITPSIRQLDGSFEVNVQGEFMGMEDPALLASVAAELAEIPA